MQAAKAEETKGQDGGDDIGCTKGGPEEGQTEGQFGALEEVGLKIAVSQETYG